MAKQLTNILEFFEKHPNTIYEFLTVLDMDVKNEPYYCIAVFKKEDSLWTESVLIPVELLRRKYKVGYFYQKDKRILRTASVKKDFVNIETKMNDKPYQMGVIFNDYLVFPAINKEYLKKYFDKQWAYKIEKEDYVLIIPCYTVASRFYFMSSSMKEAVMKGSLDELYYRVYPVVNDEVKIHIKKKAGKKDLPFICRFLTSKVAGERFKYIFRNNKNAKYKYSSIISYFPVNESFNIAIEYKELDYSINNKPVRFVVNIVNDTSSLGFSKLNYRQFASSKSPHDVEIMDFPLPSKNKIKKRRLLAQDKVIRPGSPSSDNYKEVIYEKSEKDLNTLGLEINGENIYMPTSNYIEIENVDKTGSNSFEPSKSSGEEALVERFGVDEIEDLRIYQVPEVLNKSGHTVNAKTISSLTRERRRYLCGTFLYDNKCIYIVEIEHDISWTPSSWFFIADDLNDNVNIEDINKILKTYIQESQSYKKFSRYLLESYSLKFIYHNHKKGDVDNIALDSWCDNLLEKIYNSSRNLDKNIESNS